MKFPQFRVRTLLLLTAIMGVVFVACAKWRVTEVAPRTPFKPAQTIGQESILFEPVQAIARESTLSAPVRAVGQNSIPFKPVEALRQKSTRPPAFGEWAARVAICSGVLLAVFGLVGAWRARKARSPAN